MNMDMNMMFAGQLVLAYIAVVIFAIVYSYILGKRKTHHPKVVLFVSIMLAFIPPWSFFYLGLLAMKDDIQQAMTE